MHDHYSMYASFFTCELDRVDAATMETMRQSRHLVGYHSSKGWVPKLGTWGLTAMLILYYTIGNGNPPPVVGKTPCRSLEMGRKVCDTPCRTQLA